MKQVFELNSDEVATILSYYVIKQNKLGVCDRHVTFVVSYKGLDKVIVKLEPISDEERLKRAKSE
jgi:hypothetical protein